MDTQVVEVRGQHYLVDELLGVGIEVAMPVRDHGIDLIAYVDKDAFVARPLQLKVSSKSSFSIDTKYEKFPDLVLVYMWNVDSVEDVEIYALTYDEARAVGEALGWTKTKSWANGQYVTSSPSQELVVALQQYRMAPDQWVHRLAPGSELCTSV